MKNFNACSMSFAQLILIHCDILVGLTEPLNKNACRMKSLTCCILGKIYPYSHLRNTLEVLSCSIYVLLDPAREGVQRTMEFCWSDLQQFSINCLSDIVNTTNLFTMGMFFGLVKVQQCTGPCLVNRLDDQGVVCPFV